MEVSGARFSPYFSPGNCKDCAETSAHQLKTNNEKLEKSPLSTDESEASNKKNELKENANQRSANPEDRLTEEQLKELEDLKARDQEVRMHEAAHLAAAGQHAKGGPSFDYQQGPDGKRYAVGGEVSIDTSKVPNDPEATIAKAQQIRAAALAPAEPSSQDRQVAAEAAQMEAQARAEMQEQQREAHKSEKSSDNGDDNKNNNSQSTNYNSENSATKQYEYIAGINPEKPLNVFNFIA